MDEINYILNELQSLWDQIERKRDFTDYTMGECEKIAMKAKNLISPLLDDPEYNVSVKKAIAYFDEAKEYSDTHHRGGNKRDSSSIMDVLTNTKFGLEEML